MVIKVLRGDVSHHYDVKRYAEDPPLRQSVAGYFDDQVLHSGTTHLSQAFIKGAGIRSSHMIRRLFKLAVDRITDSGHQADFQPGLQ